jgi:hypothetical protein
MKHLSAFSKLSVLILSLATSVAGASTLGLADSHCTGAGALLTPVVVPFHSIRWISNGSILATTTVSALGHSASVTANLRFDPIDENRMNVMEIKADGTSRKAGAAKCDVGGCTFSAWLPAKALYLRERIVPTEAGFDIVSGFQILAGISSAYVARFECPQVTE